ncbi:unnamed protein product [Notodromas monacha]|uniref:Uncharacterized protein n=1 Tax=Notodromas monacha TaxID=399045 RepID=A0A7R9BWH5_9CRUS|nr:unnamed protein product [Notodromas monacha]CAG0921880.1 unnamed protein product [Notodromas monacha]
MKIPKSRETFDSAEKHLRAPVLSLKAVEVFGLENCWLCSVHAFFRIAWLLDLLANLIVLFACGLGIYGCTVLPAWIPADLCVILAQVSSYAHMIISFFLLGLLALVALLCVAGDILARIQNLHENTRALTVTIAYAAVLFFVSLAMFASWPVTIWMILAIRTAIEREKRRLVRNRVKGARAIKSRSTVLITAGNKTMAPSGNEENSGSFAVSSPGPKASPNPQAQQQPQPRSTFFIQKARLTSTAGKPNQQQNSFLGASHDGKNLAREASAKSVWVQQQQRKDGNNGSSSGSGLISKDGEPPRQSKESGKKR